MSNYRQRYTRDQIMAMARYEYARQLCIYTKAQLKTNGSERKGNSIIKATTTAPTTSTTAAVAVAAAATTTTAAAAAANIATTRVNSNKQETQVHLIV